MTLLALIYLFSGVMITAAAVALSCAAYQLTFQAGFYSSGEARFFHLPEQESSAMAVVLAFASGIFFALAGALLHASMMAA